MRNNVALALAGLCCVFGFWLGEGASPPWVTLPVASGVSGCLAVGLIVTGKAWFKTLAAVGALAVYAMAFSLGWLSFNHAYDECVERGEEVRVQLSEYHQKRNEYPERLDQLEGFDLCARIVRPTVLEYGRTNGGYVLSFKDWLIEHTATEAAPFMAHK